MKKLFTAVIACCLLTANAYSQSSDPEAMKLLKTVSQKYSSFKTMTMDLTLIVENLETKSKETKSGKLMSKGSMFNLTLGNQQLFCDGKTIWTFLKDVNEVQINNFEQGAEILTINDMLKVAEKDYLVYMGEKLTEGGKNIQILELTPKNKSLSFSKIKMYINTADNSLVKGVMFDKNAIHYTITYTNFKSNVDLQDTSFKFDNTKFPGVEVIDLRE